MNNEKHTNDLTIEQVWQIVLFTLVAGNTTVGVSRADWYSLLAQLSSGKEFCTCMSAGILNDRLRNLIGESLWQVVNNFAYWSKFPNKIGSGEIRWRICARTKEVARLLEDLKERGIIELV